MNKPATKEPSMDEILSSIRQIIADDDAGGAPRKPAISAAPPPPPAARAMPEPEPEYEPEPEPLALTAEQMLRDLPEAEPEPEGFSFDDILGETQQGDEPEMAASSSFVLPDSPPPPRFQPLPLPERSRPAAPISRAAPLPEPQLTEDMAEQLIEPATEMAVQGAFARISNLSGIGTGITIEQMLREMLKPMLKEWLDENLPSMVERIVEQEIARAARGGR
jgi:cell pole-organizing protein PopZ